MRHFLRIFSGVDVMRALLAVQRQPELWNVNRLRTSHPQTPHREVDDIWLRFNAIPAPGHDADVVDDREAIDYPALTELPGARAIVFELMARVEGERLGRVLVTRLAPGKRIYPHADGGAPAEYYERFHICLQAGPGTLFRCADETVTMLPGDIWWVDNRAEHEVVNNSADDRIHIIVDIKCAGTRLC